MLRVINKKTSSLSRVTLFFLFFYSVNSLAAQENTVKDPTGFYVELFNAINQQKWDEVKEKQRELIVDSAFHRSIDYFISGVLAYHQKQFSHARGYLEKALQHEPHFTRAKLELLKVYIAGNQKGKAKQMIAELQQQPTVSPKIKQQLTTYWLPKTEQHVWLGRAAIGYLHSDNINRSPDLPPMVRCLGCYQRSVPPAKSDNGMLLNGMLWYHYQAMPQYSLFAQGTAQSKLYSKHTAYNEAQWVLHTGYRYYWDNQSFSIGPVGDYHHVGHSAYLRSLGVKGEWTIHPTSIPKLALSFSQEAKYRDFTYHTYYNGWQFQPQLTLSYLFPFASVYSQSGLGVYQHRVVHNNYNQFYSHLGANWRGLPYVDLTTAVQWQRAVYSRYRHAFRQKRQDTQWYYSVKFAPKQGAFWGIKPAMQWNYWKNNSNVEWLYGYKRHDVYLLIERQF